MKAQIENLKKEIERIWNSTTSNERRNRPTGCPTYTFGLKKELRDNFTKQEIHVAFNRGLIGNNGHSGSIVKNACYFED